MKHTKENLVWLDAYTADKEFYILPYMERVLVAADSPSNPFSDADFRDRVLDCLVAMEGIEDPAKLRKAHEKASAICVKSLDYDTGGMLRKALFECRDALCEGESQ